MKIPSVEIRTKDAELVDWMDNTASLLNNGRYQYRVLSTIPDWTANEGEAVLYHSGSDRRLYIYMGGQWCYAAWITTSGIFEMSMIQDANHDTRVMTEKTANEDKVRVDTAGTERVVIDSSGVDVKTGDLVVASGGKIGYEGISGDSYWKYNSATTYMELYTNGELRLQA